MRTCHRHYPGRFNGACSLICLHCQRPSPCNSKVGSCDCFFGACSAFTHVMACTLAESPSDPLHRELRQLCCLRCRLDCYRVERTSSRAGVAPAVVQRLSRRTVTPIEKIAYHSAARRYFLVVDDTSTFSGAVGRRANYLMGMSVCFENHPTLGTEPQNILTEGTYLVMPPVGAVRAKTSKRQFKTSAT